MQDYITLITDFLRVLRYLRVLHWFVCIIMLCCACFKHCCCQGRFQGGGGAGAPLPPTCEASEQKACSALVVFLMLSCFVTF